MFEANENSYMYFYIVWNFLFVFLSAVMHVFCVPSFSVLCSSSDRKCGGIGILKTFTEKKEYDFSFKMT